MAMENFICVQCGTQFSETVEPPPRCPICEDERQFVRHAGQEWTTLKRLATDHRNRLEEEAPRLLGIGTEPEFAIGQRALLLQSPGGNLLWDCITLLDDHTIAEINARGGIRAIAISHPHFYSSMIEWAERFDAQIFLHVADREWVMRSTDAGSRIQFWKGTTFPLWDDLTLIHRRENRTFPVRSHLRRLVAGERSIGRESRSGALSRTLSTRHRSVATSLREVPHSIR